MVVEVNGVFLLVKLLGSVQEVIVEDIRVVVGEVERVVDFNNSIFR